MHISVINHATKAPKKLCIKNMFSTNKLPSIQRTHYLRPITTQPHKLSIYSLQ